MNTEVYYHRVSRVAAAMLERASERLLADGVVEPEQFRRWTDADLKVALRAHAGDVGERLAHRELYDVATTVPRDEVPEPLRPGGGSADAFEAARRRRRGRGGRPPEVIVDPPPPVGLEEAEARIADGGEVRPLHEVTDLAGASVDFEESRLPLGVYAPAECADSVRRAAESLLRDGGR